MAGFRGADLFSKDRHVLDLIDEASSDLGSRFFIRIREQMGLAYYVGSSQLQGLVPGMFAKAEIAIAATNEAPAPVLAIPDEAVQTIEGATCVFVPVAGEANTFAMRRIVAGKRVGGFVPVESGLANGEPFVATGSFILKADLGKSTAHGD